MSCASVSLFSGLRPPKRSSMLSAAASMLTGLAGYIGIGARFMDTCMLTFASLQLENCGLSDVTLEALRQRGITSLFPIQKHVYEPANSGRDLIGRAKTGSGKTLAFALPVIEKIMQVSRLSSHHFKSGNVPRTCAFKASMCLAA